MPRVTHSIARKDYPEHGIKKGEGYFSWSFFRQPVQRSKTRPRPSQLTQSKWSGALAAQEGLEDALDQATSPEDVAQALRDCATAAESVASEYEDALSNLNEAFQGGSPTIDEHEEKKAALESYVSDLEEAANDVDGMDLGEFIGSVGEPYEKKPESFDDLNEGDKQAMLDAALETANNVELSA